MSRWNDSAIVPLVADVYRVKLPYHPYEAWAVWDGERWCTWGSTKERAARATFRGPDQGYCWRVA
jgi:hypothetical protein